MTCHIAFLRVSRSEVAPLPVQSQPSYLGLNSLLSPAPTTPLKCLFPSFISISVRVTQETECCCCSSVTQSCLTVCNPMDCPHQASLSFTTSQSLHKLTSIKLVMPSNHLLLCCPLLLLPSIFSSIRVFSNELALHIRWPMYWSLSFSTSPSMNIQGGFPLGLTDVILLSNGLSRVFSNLTFKIISSSVLSLLVQLSHLCMITGKPQL